MFQNQNSEASSPLLSWQMGPFVKPADVNPVISPLETLFECKMRGKPIGWERAHVFNPAAVVRNGLVCLIYRAEDGLGKGYGAHTSRLGLATSDDGIHFERHQNPVLFPAEDNNRTYEWPGGCEDPRIVEAEDGSYYLYYTAWDHDIARLSVATSLDLVTWVKHGPIFTNGDDQRFLNQWSKSGAVVTKKVQDRWIAAHIDGKFWMYWGEGDVYAATSDDLIHWRPVLDDASNLKILFTLRPGCFDSALCEPGPPALLTDHGIILLYNGKNCDKYGDSRYAPGTYCAGQALFNPANPLTLLERPTEPFLCPEFEYERTGQYTFGTVFIEGLVFFKGKWLLYYGAADSHIAVAQWEPDSLSES